MVQRQRQPHSGSLVNSPRVVLFSADGVFFGRFTRGLPADGCKSRDDSRSPDLLKSEQMNRVFWGIALKMTYRFIELPPSASDPATVFEFKEGDVADLT